jgi:hypothetical protein
MESSTRGAALHSAPPGETPIAFCKERVFRGGGRELNVEAAPAPALYIQGGWPRLSKGEHAPTPAECRGRASPGLVHSFSVSQAEYTCSPYVLQALLTA